MKKYRKGVFLVTYMREKGKIIYLLLHRVLHWKGWEFPKGGIENGEEKDIEKTIKREIKEETGLRVKKITDMEKSGKFKYKRELPDRPGITGQSWQLYAVEVEKGKVKLDKKEHDKYRWLTYGKASTLLTWANQKRCLKNVDEKLRK